MLGKTASEVMHGMLKMCFWQPQLAVGLWILLSNLLPYSNFEKKKKDCMFNKPWLQNCSVCVFSNKHPQRIVCDKLVLFPTGWFLGWAISFLKSVSCSVLQGEYMNIVISIRRYMHKVYRNLTTKASWIMLLWIWACTMVSRTHSPMFTCLVSDSYGKVCFSFCFLWKCDKICW